jgi:CheY-like chemotaxis protein
MRLSHALIVDDSRTSAALLAKMLARSDISSDKVVSGEACLSYLAGTSPDVIFMDHMMPGMDGFDAVKAIKQQPRLAAIPIVMYTSKGGDMYRGQAQALGAVGVLQKPAAEQDVVDLLQQLRGDGPGQLSPLESASLEDTTDAMNPAPGVNNARLAAGSAPALPGWASAKEAVANDCRAARQSLSHALVVDDSRTSAALLAKMLARHGLTSDKVISGEACLIYLASSQPDIIFMDHMMPGMDGFEAVKAIKRQSRLAAIPIVMYTSKGGEMYIGQARALGAVGVLEKPASEEALVTIIEELQPQGAESNRAVEVHDTAPVVVAMPMARVRQTVTVVEDNVAPVDAIVAKEPTRTKDAFQPSAESSRGRRQQQRLRRRLLLAGLLVLLLWLFAMAFNSNEEQALDQPALLDSLSILGNQQPNFVFGDIPFDDQRQLALEQIVRILQLAGIGAEIELRANVGEFCRIYADTGKTVLPGPDLPIEQCDMIGYEPSEAQALASSQSLNFRLFVEKLNREAGDIHIKLVPVGVFEPIVSYPPDTEITRAGDWNHTAARNQRVELILRPDLAIATE